MEPDKAAFVTMFVVNFMAARAAKVWQNADYGRWQAVFNDLPVSEGFDVAEAHWERFRDELKKRCGNAS